MAYASTKAAEDLARIRTPSGNLADSTRSLKCFSKAKAFSVGMTDLGVRMAARKEELLALT